MILGLIFKINKFKKDEPILSFFCFEKLYCESSLYAYWIYNNCLIFILLELNEKITPAENPDIDKNDLKEKDALLQKMEMAIKQLNSEQQQCVNLFYLQKKSYAEIAEETGFSMLQVKSHLQNGKRNLKLLMGI